MYPYTLKHMLATGRPGYIYPIIYSVTMFKPGVCSSATKDHSFKFQIATFHIIEETIGFYFILYFFGEKKLQKGN